MCDCYGHKCDNPKCDELIPIHIGDFCTPRDNLEVYCTRHIPKDFDGRVWKWFKAEPSEHIPKGFKVGIRIKDATKLEHYPLPPNLAKVFPDYDTQGRMIESIHPNSVYCEEVK